MSVLALAPFYLKSSGHTSALNFKGETCSKVSVQSNLWPSLPSMNSQFLRAQNRLLFLSFAIDGGPFCAKRSKTHWGNSSVFNLSCTDCDASPKDRQDSFNLVRSFNTAASAMARKSSSLLISWPAGRHKKKALNINDRKKDIIQMCMCVYII